MEEKKEYNAECMTTEEALYISEEKYRHLVDNSHDIIYILTNEGLFTFVSRAWTDLLGHPVDQVVGHQFQLFVHPDDLPVCLAWLQKVIETKQRQEGVEYRVQHLDGSWKWHTSCAVPIFDKVGAVIGLEGTARDITEQKRNVDSIENYMHILTHDLRGPLNPILGFSSLISEGNISLEEAIRYADIIYLSGIKALNLIERYLLLEKVERGQAVLDKVEKTVFEIISEIKKTFFGLGNSGCTLSVTQKMTGISFPYSGFFQKIIAIDPNLLDSALSNLLKNAVEAVSNSQDNKIIVNIFEEDSKLCLSIYNAGEIPEEVQKNLFKKFSTSKANGTGLGLYSAKLLIEAQGGELFYEPLPSETKFIIKIPYQKGILK